VDNKTEEFLKKNPNGQVPVLDSPDGPIWESNAIAKYVTRKGQDKGLYGSNEYEASQIDQWIEFFRSKIESHGETLLGSIRGWFPFSQENYDKAKSNIEKALAVMNRHLEGKDWFVGKRVTLADIILFVVLSELFVHITTPHFMKPFPHVSTWANLCAAEKQFQSVLPHFSWATKEKQPGELKDH